MMLTIAISCLAAAFVLALVAIIAGLRPLRATANYRDPESGSEPETKLPKASVVVYAPVSEEMIGVYVEKVMKQDYPDFEVIIVCETNHNAVRDLAAFYSRVYSNLYITFIPPESHSLSRKKLAFTVGMKAAKGDVVVTTAVNADIPSERWLRLMMEPFADAQVEVVLGYSRENFRELRGAGKWYAQFDSVMTACQWIGSALHHHPYRGDGNNLAFRRRLFFDNSGYASSLFLETGDDDLFVSAVANGDNTRVVLDPETRITMEWGIVASNMRAERKEHYMFTAQYLPQGPFLRAGFFSMCQWLVLALCAAGVVFGSPYVWAWVSGTLIALWGEEIRLYRKAAKRLGAIRLWWSVPLFMLWRPIGNFLFSLSHRKRRIKNFSWQK